MATRTRLLKDVATELTSNLAGQVRRATMKGRQYLVAPLSMIVPGVLPGSRGPLYYPPDEIANNFDAWNGMPIVVYHPTKDGRPISARDPEVLEKQGIGMVLKAKVNNKLTAEGWFDIEAMEKVDPRVLQSLMRGEPIELSTGLYTDNEVAQNGAHYNGKPYTHIARNYRPDHLAILPDQKGACSINDGCGVLINKRGGKKMPAGSRWVTIAGAPILVSGKGKPLSPVPGHVKAASSGKASGGPKSDKPGKTSGAKPETATPKPKASKAKGKSKPKAEEGKKANVDSAQLPGRKATTSKSASGANKADKSNASGAKAKTPKAATAEEPKTTPAAPKPSFSLGDFKKFEGMPGTPKTPIAGPWGKGSPALQAYLKAHMEKLGQQGGQAVQYGQQAIQNARKLELVLMAKKSKGAKLMADERAANIYPTSNSGGKIMALKPAARTRMIGFITANCGCWNGQEDVLSGLSDDALKQVKAHVANEAEKDEALIDLIQVAQEAVGEELALNELPAALKKAMIAKGKKPAAKKPSDASDEEEDVEEEETTTNQGTPTMNSVDDRLTKEEQEDLAYAREQRQKEKTAVVNKLTAHVKDAEQKKAITANFMKKPLADLKEMALLVPEAAPVANYAGAAGGPANLPTSGEVDRDDVLMVPTINYAEEYKNRYAKTA